MKIFSPALKRQIKDCILALLWPKREVYNFFKDHSCPVNVLKTIDGWDEKRLSRADMVNEVFNALGELPDNGTVHFNLMLDSLANWTHFDEYWFKAQQKLDLESAQKKIAALKQAKEKNIDTARQRIANNKKKSQPVNSATVH